MKLLVPFVAVVVLLTGCTATTPPPTTTSTSTSSTVGISGVFDVGCSSLVPPESLEAMWGSKITPRPYSEAGAVGSWEMQATALIQDGALACAWGLPESRRPQLVVLALDDAIPGFNASEASFLEGSVFAYEPAFVGDRSSTFCRNDSPDAGIQCHWNVLSGNTWISIFFQGIPESEVTSGRAVRDALSGDIVSSVVSSLDAASRTAVTRSTSTVKSCDATLTPAVVSGIFAISPDELSVSSDRSLEASMGRSTPLFGQVMWAHSYARLGYSDCSFIGPEGILGTAMVAPGASWILDEPDAKNGTIVEVDDLGRGIDECQSDGGFTLCTVAVALGNDLVLAQVAPSSAEEGRLTALALVRTMLEQ